MTWQAGLVLLALFVATGVLQLVVALREGGDWWFSVVLSAVTVAAWTSITTFRYRSAKAPV